MYTSLEKGRKNTNVRRKKWYKCLGKEWKYKMSKERKCTKCLKKENAQNV